MNDSYVEYDDATLREHLRAFLESRFGFPPIADDTGFVVDLGMDSMSFVVMILVVEKEFEVQFPDTGIFEQSETFRSFSQKLVSLIHEQHADRDDS